MALSRHKPKRRPVIAILTVGDDTKLFRGNLANFIDLIKTGRDMGALVYVTTTANLRLSQKKIVGHSYNAKKKSWKKKKFPLPHVVYNRIPYRKFELRPEVQQVIQSCLKHRKIQLFNPSFFNKWTLFEWLSRSNSTRSFIPKTERLISPYNLESMFHHSPTLYLKPARGKAGMGIMRLVKKQDRFVPEYRLVYQKQDKRYVYIFNNIYHLWEKLKTEIGKKEYIVQQGIVLTKFKKRPFDLRLLVQKNGKGVWTLTGMGARVAGKLSITTHVPRGGSIDDPVKLLEHKFGPVEAKKIIRKVGKSALLIARQIEKSSGYKMGEMSMDVGVDTNGKMWFFEANSKPMKFDEPEIRKKSLERLIEYCNYLCKLQRKKKPNQADSASGSR